MELEDETKCMRAQTREARVVELARVLTREDHTPGGGAFEKSDDIEKRAFARARRSHQLHVIYMLDEDLHGGVTNCLHMLPVGLRDPVDL